MKPEDFILMPIPASRYVAVCALLGGATAAAIATPSGNVNVTDTVAAPQPVAEPSANAAEASPAVATSDTGNVPAVDGEIDAHGHPWSADLHASTKGKTKDGLWRMKVGVTRPDPLPGFPKDTGTSSETGTNSATSPAVADQANGQSATVDEDDEFAAFREASAASNEADAAAAAAAPTARQWSDADLGALCNQAAVKLGDPAPIKAIISEYVPASEVQHSRNIPADKREDFAKAVEAKAEIQFAG